MWHIICHHLTFNPRRQWDVRCSVGFFLFVYLFFVFFCETEAQRQWPMWGCGTVYDAESTALTKMYRKRQSKNMMWILSWPQKQLRHQTKGWSRFQSSRGKPETVGVKEIISEEETRHHRHLHTTHITQKSQDSIWSHLRPKSTSVHAYGMCVSCMLRQRKDRSLRGDTLRTFWYQVEWLIITTICCLSALALCAVFLPLPVHSLSASMSFLSLSPSSVCLLSLEKDTMSMSPWQQATCTLSLLYLLLLQ